MAVVIAIDAGTTGVRAFAVDEHGAAAGARRTASSRSTSRDPGWVEHDAEDIWRVTVETLGEVARELAALGETVAAIGITNQRETAVVWDRAHRRAPPPRDRVAGPPHRRPLRRAARARATNRAIRARTGLVLDPYFSATKLAWLLHEGGVAADADLAFGTVDSWILWRLTGGADGGVHATDPSNASRTMLFDIGALDWSDELCALFDVPRRASPTCCRRAAASG